MSQTKKLVYGIALLVLAIAGYLQYGLDRSEENPANVDTKKKEQSLPAVETKVSAFEEEVTDSAKERDESTAADSNEEDNTDNIPQNYENTDATDDEEVEDEAPVAPVSEDDAEAEEGGDSE